MPTKSDVGIAVLHEWLNMYSRGSVQWAPGTQPAASVPLERGFNTWNRHTKHCVHYKKTVKGFLALQPLLKQAVGVSLAASVVAILVPGRASLQLGVLGLGLVAACMLVAQWLEWRILFFYGGVPPGNPPGNVDLVY